MSSRSTRQSIRKKDAVEETVRENTVLSLPVTYITDDDVNKIVIGINLTSEEISESTVKKKRNAQSRSIQKSVTKNKSSRKLKDINEHSTEQIDEENEDKYEDNDEDWEGIEVCEKPFGLCEEDDVAGSDICSFRTPKKRRGMIHKAVESAKKNADSYTPKSKMQLSTKSETPASTPRRGRPPSAARTPSRPTPKKNTMTPMKIQEEVEVKSSVIPKTPYQLRARQKRAIQAHRRKLEAIDSDSGDSDYRSSDDSWRTDSESEDEVDDALSHEVDSASDSGKDSEDTQPSCRRSLRFPQPRPVSSKSKKIGNDVNYVFTADEYFQSKSSKCATSDHRLSRLTTPRLDSAALQTLLANCAVTPAHRDALAQRRAHDGDMFQRWMFALSQGFSVLVYGLGSKYNILQNFHREMLKDSHVLVVNGFFPTLNIKEIVESIARDLLGLKQTLPTAHAIVDWIESRKRSPRVFLLVHNLDADMLRCEKTQRVLSRLAALPRVHLVASVDHINCPLLWDQAKLSNFNFMWEDATSFLPYREETSYETSLMVHNSGALALSSLLSVYRSLTHNSRCVFRIILEKHLDENNPKYWGMAFSTLYSRCREEMVVTSDLALRTMLTEFLDHQMVKWRRDNEHLYIPTDTGILKQFHKIIQDSS